MNQAEAIRSDSNRKNILAITAALGVLITVLMVLSSFTGALAVNAAAGSISPSHSAAPLNKVSTAQVQSPSAVSTAKPVAGSDLSRLALQKQIQSTIATTSTKSRTALPPNILGGAMQKGDLVSPLYSSAPAPMGIGDFGLVNTTGTMAGTVLDTSAIEGGLTLNSLNGIDLQNAGPSEVTFQLNTVVVNVTEGASPTGQYWIQNVPFYDGQSHLLEIENNVWNFSSYGAGLPTGTLQGNGTISGNEYYYDYVVLGYITTPFTINLYNNETVASPTVSPYKSYSSEVSFGYNVIKAGKTVWHGTYDNVYFNSTEQTAPTVKPTYQINGQQCSDYATTIATGEWCLLLDAELMVGGPGDGSTAILNNINATMGLWTLSGTSWDQVASAFDFGTDTGETSLGVTEWYTTPGTVNLGPGPSFLIPLWNASGKTSDAGAMKITGAITPSNAFLFFEQGNLNGKTWVNATAQWSPTPSTGVLSFDVAPGNYTVQALLSDYNPSALTAVTQTLHVIAIPLTANTSMGIYTPLMTWGNQVANISSSGSGTAGSPYIVENVQTQSLWPEFGYLNDYGFPVFPGVLIADTSDKVAIDNPAQYYITYQGPWATAAAAYGLPPTNSLPIELWNTSAVNIWGGSSIKGAYSFEDSPEVFAVADVILWNATGTLIGDNTFSSSGTASSVFIYNNPGSKGNNVIWGNTFEMSPTASTWPVALMVDSDKNIVFNNILNTPVGAYTPTVSWYTGAPETYTDTWNVSKVPATTKIQFNGENLTGNILGYNWTGGNWWSGYTANSPLPYNESVFPYTSAGYITKGGDYLPLNYQTPAPPLYEVTFTESGISAAVLANATWTLNVSNGLSQTTNATSMVFFLAAGTYNYTVTTTVSGWYYAPTTGSVTVTKAQSVTVTFTSEALKFTETGITTGLGVGNYNGAWTVTLSDYVAQMTWTQTSNQSSITFNVTAGTYNYTASTNLTAYFYTSATLMNVTVGMTAPGPVSVPFLATPVAGVSITSGLTNDLYTGPTDLSLSVTNDATAADYGVTEAITIVNLEGTPGASSNPAGAACPSGAWFYEALDPTQATQTVSASITNASSLDNFCFPVGDTDLPYGAYQATVTISETVVTPLTGASTSVTVATLVNPVSTADFFHVFADLSSPSSGATFLPGNVSIAFGVIWAQASAKTITITGPAGFSPVSLKISSQVVSGNYTVVLSIPGTYTVSLALNDTLNTIWPSASYSTNNTITILSQPNTVVTIYDNTTSYKEVGGVSEGVIAAVLIVIGIVVGAILGYFLLAPKGRGGNPPKSWEEPPKTA